MKNATKRRLALMLGLAVAASLSVATAAPSGAAEPTCSTLLETTPGIEADIDGDGYPDYRAPRIYDVTLCSETGAGYVTYPPTINNCSTVPKSVRCMAVYVTILPAYAGAYAYAELCYSIEGVGRSCEPIETGQTRQPERRTICIGYDLDGGHPCSGTVFTME